ncbi:hypothetical protein [Hymenobacter rubidus]|uniref:hypothetical protein n=1 Tax=Hymenobacter rubidus TaxID=1441626 RepID=UPI00191F247F|nr:hypothetical protein [Hymenobacter rubidus]
MAILLNAAFLAWVLPWVRRQWQQAAPLGRAAFAVGLGGRLALGLWAARHLLYDAHIMSLYSRQLTAQLWADPAAAWQALVGNEMHAGGYHMIFHGLSNTFFFTKILGLLNLASLSTDWPNSVYLSVFSFAGCWQLARAVARTLPQTPAWAPILAFVVWPTAILWTSGVTKESVVVSSGAWLLAMAVQLIYGPAVRSKWQRVGQGAAMLALALLHFNMRYFFAVALIGALVALGVVRLLQPLGWARSRWAQAVLMLAVLSGGAWLAAEVSVAFRLNKFVNQVSRIYTQDLEASAGKPHFEYPDMQPTLESIVRHVPQAIANVITRPWLGESGELRYVAAGLENLVLLLLLAVALLAVWRGKAGRLPFGLVLALLIQCAVVAALIGLSTPNLGSLHRYRSGMLPYLLLLLLQNGYAVAAMRRLGLRNETAWPPRAVAP